MSKKYELVTDVDKTKVVFSSMLRIKRRWIHFIKPTWQESFLIMVMCYKKKETAWRKK